MRPEATLSLRIRPFCQKPKAKCGDCESRDFVPLSDEIIRYHLTGSHRIWYSPTGYRLPIQEGRSGKAKGYQVEQFLGQYEVENEKA